MNKTEIVMLLKKKKQKQLKNKAHVIYTLVLLLSTCRFRYFGVKTFLNELARDHIGFCSSYYVRHVRIHFNCKIMGGYLSMSVDKVKEQIFFNACVDDKFLGKSQIKRY